MKKVLFILIISIFMVGCGNKNKDVLLNFKNSINNLDAYHMKGTLELVNGEDIYLYNVDSSYKKSDLFRVALKNTNNNHTQILLKNSEGVYVLTPSLNKSFKFQSSWPYNNSQIYLLQTILKDIEDDKERIIEATDDGYIINSKVNYVNNSNLVKQKVYLNKNYEITKVEVINNDGNTMMRLNIDSINTKPNFDKGYFEVDSSLNTSVSEEAKAVSKIESVIYPMYVPSKTYLSSQDKLNTETGQRVILTFDGESPFMLVQETSIKNDEMSIIPSNGTFEMVSDTIGVLSDNSISWSSNGIDYYVTSNSLSENELISVANSLNVMPVGK